MVAIRRARAQEEREALRLLERAARLEERARALTAEAATLRGRAGLLADRDGGQLSLVVEVAEV